MDESIGNLTKCFLCTERMSNPKFLPCYHTFCCQCIKKLCHGQSSGSVLCPVCKSAFDIPKSGDIGKMRTNVYARELIRVKTELLEARSKLAAQESEAEKLLKKTMTNAEASLFTAKESCQNLCRQLQQTNQYSKLANASRKLEKLEKEMKTLNDQLWKDKQSNLMKGFY